VFLLCSGSSRFVGIEAMKLATGQFPLLTVEGPSNFSNISKVLVLKKECNIFRKNFGIIPQMRYFDQI